MKTLLAYCLLSCLCPLACAGGPGDEFPPIGLGAYSLHFNDLFSITHNQASLAEMTHVTAGAWMERRFSLRAASTYHFGVTLPASSGSFALTGTYFGYETFNQQQAGLAYGRHIGKRLDIGLQIDYLAAQVAGYGNASAFTGEVGIIWHITDHWHAGLHVFNPEQVQYDGNFKETATTTYTLGFGYEPSEKVMLAVEANRDVIKRTYGNLAVQYGLSDNLAVLGGFSTDADQDFLGIRLQLGNLQIDMYAGYHPQLGITPGAGFLYTFK